MATKYMTIKELLDALRAKRWTNKAISEELGVSNHTVARWRMQDRGAIRQSPLVRRALEELLERP